MRLFRDAGWHSTRMQIDFHLCISIRHCHFGAGVCPELVQGQLFNGELDIRHDDVDIDSEARIAVFLYGESSANIMGDVKQLEDLSAFRRVFSILVEPLDSLKNSASS